MGKGGMIIEKIHALEYKPGGRFVVEIRDGQTGRVFYSKRIRLQCDAEGIRDKYNRMKDFLGIVIDTKKAQSESWGQI